MLGRAQVVGTSCEGSDDTVFSGCWGAGVVVNVAVGVSGFSVYIYIYIGFCIGDIPMRISPDVI